MPDGYEGNKMYSGLEKLSVEELESIIRSDFVLPDGEVPDVDYVLAIMEVIKRKKEKEPGYTPLDVDACWQDFQNFYKGQEPLLPSPSLEQINDEKARNEKNAEVPQLGTKGGCQPRRKKVWGPLRYVIAAVVAVLLTGTLAASAFGVNIFQVFVHWTTETFGFTGPAVQSTTVGNDIPGDDSYAQLRRAVRKFTELPVVPTWAPPGNEQVGDVLLTKRLDSEKLHCKYSCNGQDYTLTVFVYSEPPSDFDSAYQKDDRNVSEYEAGGILHYIMSNNENSTAVWLNETVEVQLQGCLSTTNLKQMIDSIYGE